MGTRSNTVVRERYGANAEFKPILNMYGQMDGYPSGHGLALAGFLTGLKIVNGIGLNKPEQRIANGPGCLAAQLVAHFKEGVGGFYLEPMPDTLEALDNDYAYIFDFTSPHEVGPVEFGAAVVTVLNYGKPVLEGASVAAFTKWCKKFEA